MKQPNQNVKRLLFDFTKDTFVNKLIRNWNE